MAFPTFQTNHVDVRQQLRVASGMKRKRHEVIVDGADHKGPRLDGCQSDLIEAGTHGGIEQHDRAHSYVASWKFGGGATR